MAVNATDLAQIGIEDGRGAHDRLTDTVMPFIEGDAPRAKVVPLDRRDRFVHAEWLHINFHDVIACLSSTRYCAVSVWVRRDACPPGPGSPRWQ